MANWVDVIGETRGRLIAEFELFDSFIALVDEHDAVESARVVRLADMHELAVPLPEIGVAEISFAQGAANRDASASVLQLNFLDLSTPRPNTISTCERASCRCAGSRAPGDGSTLGAMRRNASTP